MNRKAFYVLITTYGIRMTEIEMILLMTEEAVISNLLIKHILFVTLTTIY